jgi:spore germination protein YaaH
MTARLTLAAAALAAAAVAGATAAPAAPAAPGATTAAVATAPPASAAPRATTAAAATAPPAPAASRATTAAAAAAPGAAAAAPAAPAAVATSARAAATAPGAPGAPRAAAVTDTTVTLTWAASKGDVRGYRVVRDGRTVRQVAGRRVKVTNLAPKTAYRWTVRAVGAGGAVSKPSPATRVVQGDPPPATGSVHAYLLASTDASYAAFREHYRQISHVYPTFYDCNRTSGALEGRDNDRIVRYAQDRKVKVLPRVNCQSTAILQRILGEPELREQWLSGIVQLVDEHGYDGINVDFEAIRAEDRDRLTAFVAELASRLHAKGKLLSQALSAKRADNDPSHPRSAAFDYRALAKYADVLFVMGWGVHWSTSAPGAQDDIAWVRQVADYVATLPERSKWVMGTMLYGMDWPSGGKGAALHFSQIEALARDTGIAPVYDASKDAYKLAYKDANGIPHEVWFSDAGAVGHRVALAKERGLGVGFWRLGQEDERVWQDASLGSP